ncbi:hypothetical protein FUA23_07105 [Neolewinella aurantiaca]|uniref:Uncharacterized protein n=1 Tax=Neolewinella aurantiaca TaxID=2602767 RepID=A0A5C7FQY2_9BACT|nr:hypothetical protein [Neolewinella aurantiaca]TXF90280.1 hypothetical protein FUA23_07105 [Neolewinella aurantiaca]
MKNLLFLFVLVLLAGLPEAAAQQLLADRGVQAAGLWCFPVYGDELSYYYLPGRGRLGHTSDSIPEFSFLRYVTEKPAGDDARSVSAAGGGGIVNFLVLYDTPAEQVARASAALREKLDNDEVVLKGPWAFTSGRYLLVSFILQPDGTEKQAVLSTGTAPTLENNRVAFSFSLDPQRAQLLMESFKMKTPDISVVFELDYEGLTESYEAEIEVDFDEVRKSESYSAGGSVYFVGADVEVALDKMRRNNAIKMTTAGSDEHLDGLLSTVYDKLLTMLFQKVEPEKVPGGGAGMMDALGSMLGANGALGSRNTTGFGLSVGFKYKELKVSGKSHLKFNGRSTVSRKHFITFNIGDLWQQYGDREDLFRSVALYDPAFQQRAVHVNLDGSLERAFADMVNSVTVRMRKVHNSGATTLKEVMVDRRNFRDSTGQFRMVYLNDRDSSMTEWLSYEHQEVWQFTGGGTYTTDWDTTSAAMINLYTPFERRSISLEGDLDNLQSQGIRAASVKITYPFFDQERTDSRLLRPGDDPGLAPFEVTLPLGHEAIDYQISLMRSDGTPLRWRGTDQFGLIFFDEPPKD